MSRYLTSKENLSLDMSFALVGETRANRTLEEYKAIAAKLPPLKVLHGLINDKLKELADAGHEPYQICYFKAGDRHIWYEPFPKSLSIKVIRSAEVKSGMRALRPRKYRKRSVS